MSTFKKTIESAPGTEVIKNFLLLNVKMPTAVGILTFMSRKYSILGLSKSEKGEYFDTCIFILMSV